jgi:hypothetical protein
MGVSDESQREEQPMWGDDIDSDDDDNLDEVNIVSGRKKHHHADNCCSWGRIRELNSLHL